MTATIVDLRYRMKDVLRAIDRGEAVTILYRGKEKARLMPIGATAQTDGGAMPRMEDQPMFGMWKDREEMTDPVAYVRDLRRARPLPDNAAGTRRIKKRG